MISFKALAGVVSLVLGLLGYASYLTGIFKGRVRPHAFSWGLWGFMGAITFAGQHVAGAGPGAWTTGLAVLFCVLIFLLSLKYGESHITRLDCALLGVGLVALLLWGLTKDPMLAVVLVSSASIIGGNGPTLRKTYDDPFNENMPHFAYSTAKYGVALVALASWNLTTAFPLVINVLGSCAVVVMILVRREQMRKVGSKVLEEVP